MFAGLNFSTVQNEFVGKQFGRNIQMYRCCMCALCTKYQLLLITFSFVVVVLFSRENLWINSNVVHTLPCCSMLFRFDHENSCNFDCFRKSEFVYIYIWKCGKIPKYLTEPKRYSKAEQIHQLTIREIKWMSSNDARARSHTFNLNIFIEFSVWTLFGDGKHK